MTRPPIHPGEILTEEIQELGMNANQLAHALQVPPNRITQILKGQRGISAETALRLAQWFGTSPEYWLNLQKIYELRLEEEKSGEKIRSSVSPRLPAQLLAGNF